MRDGVEFVKDCFAWRAKVVEDLALRNEGFRELCDDFAIANNEKARWERSREAERAERMAEYQELIESMRAEIEQELDRAAIVPFNPHRRQ